MTSPSPDLDSLAGAMTSPDLHSLAVDMAARAADVASRAANLADLTDVDEPPVIPPPQLTTLTVTSATADRVAVQWSTNRTDVLSWTVGRNGTDTNNTGDWSTKLPPAADRTSFGSLRADTDYLITLTPDTGPSVTVTARTAPAPAVPPPATTLAQHGPRAISAGWVPLEVTRDDFAGPLDLTKWSPYTDPTSQHGNRQPSQFTFVDDPTALGGRALRVDGTPDGKTGGMANKRGLQYGRWAARVKIPAGDPRWHPVLLTWPDAENWPVGGEIDAAEMKCSVNRVEFFLHYSSANQQTYGRIDVDITRWHWFEWEWSKGGVIGWCDGVEFFRDVNPQHYSFGRHHGTIQLDHFPGDAETTGPGVMLVDAYRVYRHPDTTP